MTFNYDFIISRDILFERKEEEEKEFGVIFLARVSFLGPDTKGLRG